MSFERLKIALLICCLDKRATPTRLSKVRSSAPHTSYSGSVAVRAWLADLSHSNCII